MKRLVGALALLGFTAMTSVAMAQEIQIRGPLAGAPSCRRCRLYRAGRVSLSPTFGVSLVDDFNRTLFVGLNAQYHFNDIVAIGAWGAAGVAQIPTALTDQIGARLTEEARATPSVPDGMGGLRPPTGPNEPYANATLNIPRGDRFAQQVGQINAVISVPQLTLIPLRGKLALFQNIFIDTDFYLFGGLGLVVITERSDYDAAAAGSSLNPNSMAATDSQTARATRLAVTGTFGVGFNFYITRFMSLSFEYRAYPFSWNTMGTDENSRATACGAQGNQSCEGFPDYVVNPGSFVINDADRQFRWNQMVNFSLNFFLPPNPRVSD